MIYTAILLYFLVGGASTMLVVVSLIGKDRPPHTRNTAMVAVAWGLLNMALDIVMWLGTR